MRIPQIQALRAVAALLVLFYHLDWISGGYIGVDIFYVISGFLITGLLLRECEKTDRISLQAFYIRRIKRLLPTAFVVLLVTALISWSIYPPILRKDLAQDIAAAAVYLSNYFFAFWQMDYQNLDAAPPVVIHYWSLAVEEQFYLIWPLAIFLLFKIGSRKAVGIGIASITAISFLLSLYLTERSPVWAFYSLPTRAWELGIGALILFIPRKIKFSRNYTWIALILCLYATLQFNDSTPFPGTSALFPVIGTALAIAAAQDWPKVLDWLAKLRVVQWLGDISYPLYLWHWPVIALPVLFLGRTLTAAEKATCVVATILLAYLTHRIVEEPIRRSHYSAKRVLSLALAATALLLMVSFAIFQAHSQSISINNGTKYSLASVLEKPKVYLDGCHVNNGVTVSPDCTYGNRGSSRKIVLFGDSHAAQWMPALERIARENNLALISLTKSACPGPAVRKVDNGEYKNSDCSAWRENSFARIAALNPEAVIVSGSQHFKMPPEYSSKTLWWQEGQRKTLASIREHTLHVIYLADTPRPDRDIPSCLARGRFSECDGSKPTPPIFVAGYKRINPTAWLCDDNSCPAVVNQMVVYRDASHISVATSKSLAPKLAQSLRAIGLQLN